MLRRKKLIKVLLEEEKEEEVLEWIKANPDFPDHARLRPTVLTTIPNDHQTTLKTS